MSTHTLPATGLRPSPMLVTALRGDALLSSGPTALQLAWSGGLAALTGLPQAMLFGSGLAFVGWIALCLMLAARATLPKALVAVVIGGNLLWAVVCVEMALGAAPWGAAYLGLQAAVVTGLAAWQFAGLRRSRPAGGA